MAGPPTFQAICNPLISIQSPLVNQTVNVNASASLTVGASFGVSGAYQIRARRLTGKFVELGYYRMKGAQWSVSATASAGVDVKFGKTEFLTKLIATLTGKPEADVDKLVKGGLTDDQIEQIQRIIADA